MQTTTEPTAFLPDPDELLEEVVDDLEILASLMLSPDEVMQSDSVARFVERIHRRAAQARTLFAHHTEH